MRTDDEILAEIKRIERTKLDWIGTRRGNLIQCLPVDKAKPFCNPEADLSDWEQRPRDEVHVKAYMFDYMPFAWDKANNCRGLSAARSMDHMSSWLWLLGHDQASEQVLNYSQYGKPWLRAICEAFGWDWKQWDDGYWKDYEHEEGSPPPEKVEPLILSK